MQNALIRSTLAGGFAAAVVVATSAWVLPDASTSGDATAVRSSIDASGAVSYAEQIAPIFEAKCVNCHGGEWEGERRVEAGLDLTSYEGLMAGSEFGTVIEGDDVAASILFEMVEAGDMPEEGDPLTPEELELLRAWISEGAENN